MTVTEVPTWRDRYDAWTPLQIARLRELAEQYRHGMFPNVETIAQALTREFGVERTPEAVSNEACEIGVELYEPGLSLTDVATMIGYSTETIVRYLIEVDPPLLRAIPWRPLNNKGATYRVLYANLVEFVRAHPWAYDVADVQGSIRSEAELATRRHRWLTVREITQQTGWSEGAVRNYLLHGLVPARRRRAGGGSQYMIEAAQLPVLREIVQELRVDAVRRRAASNRRRHAEIM